MRARFVDGLACVEALLRRARRDVVAVVAKVVGLEGRIHRISTRQYASRRVTLLLHA